MIPNKEDYNLAKRLVLETFSGNGRSTNQQIEDAAALLALHRTDYMVPIGEPFCGNGPNPCKPYDPDPTQ